MEANKQASALALFKEILGKPEEYWDKLDAVNATDGSTCQGWRKINIEGQPKTCF